MDSWEIEPWSACELAPVRVGDTGHHRCGPHRVDLEDPHLKPCLAMVLLDQG
jgi:hypothetical protein